MKIRRATTNDIVGIVKLLPKTVVDARTQKILKQHMRDGLVMVMEDENGLQGVSAMLRAGNEVSSWTYYFINEVYRGKEPSLALFTASLVFMQATTILIKSKEMADKSTFKDYIEPHKGSKTEFVFKIPEERFMKLRELATESWPKEWKPWEV